MTSLRGRGRSASKSLAMSVSNSLSSSLPDDDNHVAQEERDDIESYFSALRNDSRDQGKIDWEKLLESHCDDEEIEPDFVGRGEEVTFLKPKPSTNGDIGNQTSGVSSRQVSAVSRAGSGKKQQSITKSQHVMVQSTEMLKGGSLLSPGSETSSGSEEHQAVTENSYSDINLLANIKMADDFLLSDEDSKKCEVDRHITAQVDTSLKCHSDRDSISPPSNLSTSRSDVSFRLKKNVFSIDQLEVAAPSPPGSNHDQQSCLSASETVDDISTSEPYVLAPNLRNVLTLDELEVSIGRLHGEENRREKPSVIGKQDEKAKKNDISEPTKTFRFNATERESRDDIKVNFEMTSPQGLEKGDYSDEEFESESLESSGSGEEEEIAEDISQRSVSETDIGLSKTVHTTRTHSPPFSVSEVEGIHRSTASHQSGVHENMTRDQDATDNTYTLTETATTSSASQSRAQRTEEKRGNRLPPSVHDASVQTLPLDTQIPSHYERVDPSPILPHVVGPDTLEAIPDPSPISIALNDLLRAQLAMTRQFIATTRQMAERVATNVREDYHYTTLEDTKAYISRHRPRVLTAQEAKKLVRREEQTI